MTGPLVVDGARPAVEWVTGLPVGLLPAAQHDVLLVLALDSYDLRPPFRSRISLDELSQATGRYRNTVRRSLDALAKPDGHRRPALLIVENATGRARNTYTLLTDAFPRVGYPEGPTTERDGPTTEREGPNMEPDGSTSELWAPPGTTTEARDSRSGHVVGTLAVHDRGPLPSLPSLPPVSLSSAVGGSEDDDANNREDGPQHVNPAEVVAGLAVVAGFGPDLRDRYGPDALASAVRQVVGRLGVPDTTAAEVVAHVGRTHTPGNLVAYLAKMPDTDLANLVGRVGPNPGPGPGATRPSRDAKPCCHGSPGGAEINPATGKPFCPFCLRGQPEEDGCPTPCPVKGPDRVGVTHDNTSGPTP